MHTAPQVLLLNRLGDRLVVYCANSHISLYHLYTEENDKRKKYCNLYQLGCRLDINNFLTASLKSVDSDWMPGICRDFYGTMPCMMQSTAACPRLRCLVAAFSSCLSATVLRLRSP